MADKSIDQLNEAERIYATDLFVLQQSGSAKKLTGQVLLNWLTAAADGHGGIQSISKLSTSGLSDTYRITLADTTVFDFVVNNGRGIIGISKTSTSGLVDTYTISYNDGTSGTLTVTNGEKGDKGDNAYIWIKYASQEPTESSHSIGDIPDDWIGIYSGNASTAPTDWKQYKWFQIKGEKGDTGDPAVITGASVEYQVSDSGTVTPSGTWRDNVPVVAQGKYLWTKTTIEFNTGDPVISYSVSRMGVDGTGSVSSVNGVSPGSDGNVVLSATDVSALPAEGGDMHGDIRMNGNRLTGIPEPDAGSDAATKAYADVILGKPTESADYPGCYYRITGTETEWINPPMAVGTEYRTTDRWLGKTVYTMLVDCGTFANNKKVTVDLGRPVQPIRASVQDGNFLLPAYDLGSAASGDVGTYWIGRTTTGFYVWLYGGNSFQGQQTYAQIWYTKG